MKVTDENNNTSNFMKNHRKVMSMSSAVHDKLSNNSGALQDPTTRHRRGSSSILTSKRGTSSSAGAGGTSVTLFQQSAMELNSFSFESSAVDESNSSPHQPIHVLSPKSNHVLSPKTTPHVAVLSQSSQVPTPKSTKSAPGMGGFGLAHGLSSRYALTPSMAQIRARRIVGDKSRAVSGKGLGMCRGEAGSKPSSTNSATDAVNITAAASESDETSTDMSLNLNVDSDTMAQVGDFIDSLHNHDDKGLSVASEKGLSVGKRGLSVITSSDCHRGEGGYAEGAAINAEYEVGAREEGANEHGGEESPTSPLDEPTPRINNIHNRHKFNSCKNKPSLPYLTQLSSSLEEDTTFDSEMSSRCRGVEAFIDSLNHDGGEAGDGMAGDDDYDGIAGEDGYPSSVDDSFDGGLNTSNVKATVGEGSYQNIGASGEEGYNGEGSYPSSMEDSSYDGGLNTSMGSAVHPETEEELDSFIASVEERTVNESTVDGAQTNMELNTFCTMPTVADELNAMSTMKSSFEAGESLEKMEEIEASLVDSESDDSNSNGDLPTVADELNAMSTMKSSFEVGEVGSDNNGESDKDIDGDREMGVAAADDDDEQEEGTIFPSSGSAMVELNQTKFSFYQTETSLSPINKVNEKQNHVSTEMKEKEERRNEATSSEQASVTEDVVATSTKFSFYDPSALASTAPPQNTPTTPVRQPSPLSSIGRRTPSPSPLIIGRNTPSPAPRRTPTPTKRGSKMPMFQTIGKSASTTVMARSTSPGPSPREAIRISIANQGGKKSPIKFPIHVPPSSIGKSTPTSLGKDKAAVSAVGKSKSTSPRNQTGVAVTSICQSIVIPETLVSQSTTVRPKTPASDATPSTPGSCLSTPGSYLGDITEPVTPAAGDFKTPGSTIVEDRPQTPVEASPGSFLGDIEAPSCPPQADEPSITSDLSSLRGHDTKNAAYQDSLAHVTSQIQEVVRSEVPSMTLGKVLADANRRGITLDVVTEIYKKERFKFSSEKIARWEAAMGVSPRERGQAFGKEGKPQSMDRSVASSSCHVNKAISDAALQEVPRDIRESMSQVDVDLPSPKQNKIASPNSNKDSDSPKLRVASAAPLTVATEVLVSPKYDAITPVRNNLRSPKGHEMNSPSKCGQSYYWQNPSTLIMNNRRSPNVTVENESESVELSEIPSEGSTDADMTSLLPSNDVSKSVGESKEDDLTVSSDTESKSCSDAGSKPSVARDSDSVHSAKPVVELDEQAGQIEEVKVSDCPSPCVKNELETTMVEQTTLSPGSKLEVLIVRIRAAVRSNNPSEEFGKILADAKKNRIPLKPLVELYTIERLTMPLKAQHDEGPPVKDIVVSPRSPGDFSCVDTEGDELECNDDNDYPTAERGLSDTQLLQLQQLVSMPGEVDRERVDYHPEGYTYDTAQDAAGQHLEDIDKFFSRFSINETKQNHTTDKSTAQDSPCVRETIVNTIEINKPSDALDEAEQKSYNPSQYGWTPKEEFNDCHVASPEQEDSSHYHERGNIAEVKTLRNGKGAVLFMQESSLEVEFVESDLQTTKSGKKKKKKTKEKKSKIIKIRPRDNRRVVVLRDDLPGYLGYWRSPWEKNRTRSHYYSANSIDGVAAAARFAHRSGNSKQRQCFLSEKERTKNHEGYRDIDFYSLYEATTVLVENQDIDSAPWDCRDVRQRFLHEKSVESRNWFGSFKMSRENERIHHPISCPKSLIMHVSRIPEEDEWDENWYTTWRSRRDNPNNLIAFAELEIQASSHTDESRTDGEDESVEAKGSRSAPKNKVDIEIGTLCPVRLKTGERISRVHPDFTSSLRRSRWKKKYISGMQFPVS